MTDPTIAAGLEAADFDEWRQFDDRAPGDPAVGPARRVEITGRCTGCWGSVHGRKDDDGRWVRIECRLCGRSVDQHDAAREADRMLLAAENNLPHVRVGRGAVYDEKAQFVLKLLPDMDRDTTCIDQRIATKQAEKPKRNRLGRRDFPMGSGGNLHGQAYAFLAGLASLPREMSAISLEDFDFGAPQIVGVHLPTTDAPVRVSGVVPVIHRQPSNSVIMARMGSALVAGMVAAFACELGMKAILMTRLDELERTHDLLRLYEALPADSRSRLEADFAGIAGILTKYRNVFGKWRYFEHGATDAMTGLVDTDRVLGLGQAARVIIDEGTVAGMRCDVSVGSDFEIAIEDGSYSEQRRVSVVGHESAIPWDAILALSPDETEVA